MKGNPTIFIGYDPRERDAFDVAVRSAQRHLPPGYPDIQGLKLFECRGYGLYTRKTYRNKTPEGRDQLYDAISEAPMSTEFAISRFLCPLLNPNGWSLFTDCDVMFRARLDDLFAQANDEYAVMCVKHNHQPLEATKMDGQEQTRYSRKNWSSVMLFNGRHPANKRLTLEMINTVPGRDLHRFCWLEDHEIGELGPEWNFLVGHTDPSVDAKIVHFTEGVPTMEGYANVDYADEWWGYYENLVPGVKWWTTPFEKGTPWAAEDQVATTG